MTDGTDLETRMADHRDRYAHYCRNGMWTGGISLWEQKTLEFNCLLREMDDLNTRTLSAMQESLGSASVNT